MWSVLAPPGAWRSAHRKGGAARSRSSPTAFGLSCETSRNDPLLSCLSVLCTFRAHGCGFIAARPSLHRPGAITPRMVTTGMHGRARGGYASMNSCQSSCTLSMCCVTHAGETPNMAAALDRLCPVASKPIALAS